MALIKAFNPKKGWLSEGVGEQIPRYRSHADWTTKQTVIQNCSNNHFFILQKRVLFQLGPGDVQEVEMGTAFAMLSAEESKNTDFWQERIDSFPIEPPADSQVLRDFMAALDEKHRRTQHYPRRN